MTTILCCTERNHTFNGTYLTCACGTTTRAPGPVPELRMVCPTCYGGGSRRVLIGPDDALAPCVTCAGTGTVAQTLHNEAT